jgi:hypothetical protein
VLIDAVSVVHMHGISAADAKRAGFDSMSALCGELDELGEAEFWWNEQS